VGTIAALDRTFAEARPGVDVSFACVPENLRLGKAIEAFTKPDRFVAGVRRPGDRARIAALLSPFTERVEWMSVESAEMTKHAINAFLATSIAFMNEIASLCEQAGADAAEVSRGLKSESRIGPGAYLSPGGAFAGGTLARDIVSLNHLAAKSGKVAGVIGSVRASNEGHRLWAGRRLAAELGSVRGRTIGIWGLTYKPGTNTLRRSSAVALCETLAAEGARVRAYDPSLTELPEALAQHVTLAADPLEAALDADALVVATAWPEFRDVSASSLLASGRAPIVLDAGRFLAASLGSEPGIRYITVGRP
jgi:UDPglucose 6-dehydrogenase